MHLSVIAEIDPEQLESEAHKRAFDAGFNERLAGLLPAALRDSGSWRMASQAWKDGYEEGWRIARLVK